MKEIAFPPKQLMVVIMILVWTPLLSQSQWKNPIGKSIRLGSPLVETSPFVFENHLYLLENNQKFWDIPGSKPGDYFHEDEIRIRDLASNEIISIPLRNHAFGTILVSDGRAYIFAGDYGQDKPWRKISEINMVSSDDLVNWSEPVTVLTAHEDEYFFNTAVCRGRNEFVLLYETSDTEWRPFTFRYVTSQDLIHWNELSDAIYGEDKYVGGPALYYENGWYYTLYLESLGSRQYETRITRSRDLLHWQDAPEDRPMVTFDTTHKNIPLIDPDISESNASDVELCYYQGETILYFTGSDQTTAGDLQRASYPGKPAQLFEHFFENATKTRMAPTDQQLAFQERQLGAFVHFGPATYLASDMLAVPPPALFNPTELNADQWVSAASSFGAKHIVLTAKHHSGFCLWPTKTTDYGVHNSPWKNGQGDVVQDFVKACRKVDLKIGLYISGGDKHFGCYSTPDPQGQRKMVGDVHAYFPIFLEQLRELLVNYGEIDYLWFDGAYDPFGWDVADPKTGARLGTFYGDAITAMVKQLQPNAIIMGGTRPDVRWSGSEQGKSTYPLRNVVEPGDGYDQWVGEHNSGWIPAEANLHTRNTWFWAPGSDKSLRDLDYLQTAYLASIGHGANLLINMTPDTSGLIPSAEVHRLAQLGNSIERLFSNPVGGAKISTGEKASSYAIQLNEKKEVNLIVLEEDISLGQTIESYQLEAYMEGSWTKIGQGETIGRKRIQVIDPITSDQFRVKLGGDDSMHFLKSFSLYHSDLE